MSNLIMASIGNDYPNSPYSLDDCCLDAERMFAKLNDYISVESELVRNEECTLANLTKIVRAFAKLKTDKTAFVIYNSGHGTSDGRRQGIVLSRGVVLWEAKLREMLRPLSPAILISDSCFAGGLERNITTTTVTAYAETDSGEFRRIPVRRKNLAIPRFVPFKQLPGKQPPPQGRMPRMTYDYFAACDSDETADSTGNGGAFTNEVLKVLGEATPRLTMKGIYNRVRKVLPNKEHQQTPQFVSSDKGFAKRTLASFMK